MRTLSRWLTRFCYNHPRLSIDNLLCYVIAGNLAVFLLNLFTGGQSTGWLTFCPGLILRGQVWRVFTFVFIPLTFSPLGFFLSLMFYYYIGGRLQAVWGSTKLTVYYLLGVLLTILTGLLMALINPAYLYYATADMQYLNLSLFFAYATLFPDLQVLFMFLIPIKVKWMAWLEGALFLYVILAQIANGAYLMALLPVIAVFNYLLFFWEEITSFSRRTKARAVHRTDPRVINFKKAQKEIQERRGYLHKCSVCGVTDADNPTMEFRYCSKCTGYYCYCMDHINNHVHIQ